MRTHPVTKGPALTSKMGFRIKKAMMVSLYQVGVWLRKFSISAWGTVFFMRVLDQKRWAMRTRYESTMALSDGVAISSPLRTDAGSGEGLKENVNRCLLLVRLASSSSLLFICGGVHFLRGSIRRMGGPADAGCMTQGIQAKRIPMSGLNLLQHCQPR